VGQEQNLFPFATRPNRSTNGRGNIWQVTFKPCKQGKWITVLPFSIPTSAQVEMRLFPCAALKLLASYKTAKCDANLFRWEMDFNFVFDDLFRQEVDYHMKLFLITIGYLPLNPKNEPPTEFVSKEFQRLPKPNSPNISLNTYHLHYNSQYNIRYLYNINKYISRKFILYEFSYRSHP
jgi:hypothetical protein